MTSNSGKLGLSMLLSFMLSAAVAGPKASQSDITIETCRSLACSYLPVGIRSDARTGRVHAITHPRDRGFSACSCRA